MKINYNDHKGIMESNLLIDFFMKSKKYTEYHKSWDSLMPVLKEIEKIGCVIEISICLVFGVRIVYLGKKHDKTETFSNNTNDGLTGKEAVWITVIEFLKWYNLKNNTTINITLKAKP